MGIDNSILSVDSIPRLIFKLAGMHSLSANRLLKPFDLTVEQGWVLVHLKAEGTVSQKELAARTFKDQASITRILGRLQGKGLIEVKGDTNDRRVNLVKISSRGETLLEEVINEVDKAYDALNAIFTEDDDSKLRPLLLKYTNALDLVRPDVK
ncbi:MAG: MarR family transcriptional regulator [Deferribacteraceae bacterium]|nr:MarR family transcriptional regulator [Deferribacteraceae bacterium]